MYYVYFLIDPRSGKPFYVGKGKEGTNRHLRHFYETEDTTENKHKFYKINYLKTAGFDIPVEIYQSGLTESEAYVLETELIELYGRVNLDEGGILTNICLFAHPPSMKGKRRSRKSVEKYIQTRTGKSYLTEEAKRQISAKLTGRTQSDITKQKRKERLKNNPKAYGRKDWLCISPTGEAYRLKNITRNQFFKEFNLSVSKSFFESLNTGMCCKALGYGGKNNGWMFFDDSEVIEKFIIEHNIKQIIK